MTSSAGRTEPGSRLTARRLTDYESRQRELTEAFVLPDDLRRWVTIRIDDDPQTPDQVTVGAQAGRTVALLTLPVPDAVARALRALLDDQKADLDHRLKLDLATNMLATMMAPEGGEA